MAKSLRASRKKANKTQLRSRVHQPVEDARIERLSAKLLEIASKPKEEVKSADTEMIENEAQDHVEGDVLTGTDVVSTKKMDVDESTAKKSAPRLRIRSNSGKVQKKRRAKMVFAVGKKHGPRPSAKGHKGPGVR